MADREALWLGKPLSEYSKEELIEIVQYLGQYLSESNAQAAHELSVLAKLRKARAHAADA